MKIDVSEVLSSEGKEMSEDVRIGFSSFHAGTGDYPVWKESPFALSVANLGDGRLMVSGETEVTVGIPCDRCLEEVPVTFPLKISREIDVARFLANDPEELENDDYMAGTDLDVDRLIFGEMMVGWPTKVLCREDCKGICKRCGANLNLTECKCPKTEPDPRMAAIQDIFDQFKEV